jgi:hypothetical protein
MKSSAKFLTLVAVVAAMAAAVPALAAVGTTPAPVTVAKYTFDAGATAAGNVAENSGRGRPLAVRTADRGAVRFVAGGTGRYVGFPAACPRAATTCPRALLEAADDADLNPGTQNFAWGASLYVSKAQVVGSPNIIQKGVSSTESQWKMQVGATQGRAQCVVVGRGSKQAYIVRSSVTVADAKWHKVLCRRAGSALIVSVDGTNRGSVAVPATLSISNTRPLRVGGPNFNTSSDMYHGFLDDVYATLG